MQDFLDHMQTGLPVVLAWLGANWIELLKALAPIGTLLVAWSALKNWKRQDKARREADFIDELVDAIHAFVVSMENVVSLLMVTRMGLDSYISVESGDDPEIQGAIRFLTVAGADHSVHLRNALNPAKEALIQMRSLTAKGQIFDFRDYNAIYVSTEMLAAEYGRAEVYAAYLQSKNLNWDHPTNQEVARGFLSLSHADMADHIKFQNAKLIAFANAIYTDLYGLKKRRAGLRRKKSGS